MDGVFDQFAKFERAKTAQRTRRGKKRKAREGKIVAPRKIAYGFKLNPERDGYIVDEESMSTVRRIFEIVAGGTSLQAIKQVLEAVGIPTPNGGERWSRSTLRALVRNDLYFPHAFEEVASMVSPNVAAGLDTSESYGIWWSTKHDWRVLARIKTPEGYYRERRSHALKPKEEWIAVQVPYAGVPREAAERARRTIDHNFRHPSKSRRIWELTGSLLHCGECGRKMHTHQVASAGRKPYFYYQCSRKAEERSSSCSNKYHKAEQLERDVRDAVSSLIYDKQRIEEQIERRIERERETMRDPDEEAAKWARRLEEIAKARGRYQDQQAAGFMTLHELGEKLHHLEEESKVARRELETAQDRQARIEEMEPDRLIVLAFYAAFASSDLTLFPPEKRRRLYVALGLRVVVYTDGRVEIDLVPQGDYFPPRRRLASSSSGLCTIQSEERPKKSCGDGLRRDKRQGVLCLAAD